MAINNMELIHGRERGNVPWMLRRNGRASNDKTNQSSDIEEMERILYDFYHPQLRLAAINLIKPQGTPPPGWCLNNDGWTQLETMIRQGFLVAVGRDGAGRIRILNTQNLSINLGLNAMMGIGMSGDGVIWDELTKTNLYPITELEPDKGDYVIFSNKNIAAYLSFFQTEGFDAKVNLAGMSDELLIQTTAQKLAVNRATAFQNMIQMRASTVFYTKNKNVTGGNIIQRWLNGFPFIGVDDSYNIQDSITTLQGSDNLDRFLTGLRQENDYNLSEYGMWLGVTSSGMQKESGVSDLEAASKLQQTESLGEIYLQARQSPLDKLCRRFGGDLKAMFNQQSAQAVLNQMETQAAQLVQQRAEAQLATQQAQNPQMQ